MVKLVIVETYELDEQEVNLCKDFLNRPNKVFLTLGRSCDSSEMKIVIEEWGKKNANTKRLLW